MSRSRSRPQQLASGFFISYQTCPQQFGRKLVVKTALATSNPTLLQRFSVYRLHRRDCFSSFDITLHNPTKPCFSKAFLIFRATYLYANLRLYIEFGVKLASEVVSSGYLDLSVKIGERFLLSVLSGFRVHVHRGRDVFMS